MQDIDLLARSIELCRRCHTICGRVLKHSLQKGGDYLQEARIQALLDCIDTCSYCLDLMSRQSPLHMRACDLCTEACTRCAASCEQLGTDSLLQECARACRDCASVCQQAGSYVA
ncbi:uncharacterized protein DUF326 [Thermosporothrix hazakensis]|uniref:Uncharacterized protein DUF326 n=1 Tax=Thermosporothrix hazakensis TaxID=644383 RepID=A0A326TYI8_THEHA|nr:four-helix bundle copper-binding protein [Thermosporothrix hazakensis]PZW22445.1 uncharacterized protein DUF326 [Thermosporothrix hazakensis]